MNKLLCVGILVGFIVHEGWCQHHFDLCNQNLRNVSKEMIKIKNLTDRDIVSVTLCNNNLTTISSDTFLHTSELDKLTLDDNNELKFPKNEIFLESQSLTKLFCIRCGIDQLYNQSLQELPNLELINLTQNGISLIEPGTFGNNRKLGEVCLMHNKLGEIPKEMISHLKELSFVDLSHNRDLAPVENQPFLISKWLKELKCDSCGFSVIYETTFSELSSLTKLHLRDNKITQIHESSFNIQVKLEVLNLQDNRLQTLDQNLLRKVTNICVNGNPIELLCFIQNYKIPINCPNTPQTEVDCPKTTTTEETQTETLSTASEERSTSVIGKAAVDTSRAVSNTTSTITFEIITSTLDPAPVEMGISNAYIGGYLTVIYLAQITMLVFLIGIWLKLKKYDSDPEVDQYAENILNPNPIYKAVY